MNQVVNKFLIVDDKFMSDLHLKQPRFIYSACDLFTRNKERTEQLFRQEIQILFMEMSLIKLAFNMIWLMANQNI